LPAEKPLETWKVIAAHLGLTVKVCRRLAWRRWDPLPILKFECTVLAYASALTAWKQRNTPSLQASVRASRLQESLRARVLAGTSGPMSSAVPRKKSIA